MYIDLTTKVTSELLANADTARAPLPGHLGTHFDVMNKEFPLDYLRLDAVVFDVTDRFDSEVRPEDIDLSLIKNGMFVAFHTGCNLKFGYKTKEYNECHTVLSEALIDELLNRSVKIIGIDNVGVRKGAEHTPMDQYCADRGAFVVENMNGMENVLNGNSCACCTINTYPVNFGGMSGLPCRVVAEV